MLIWWVNQADCEAIGELPESFPDYLRDQFKSRLGRPGRGRLWAHDRFGNVEVNPWPDTPLGKVLGNNYAGIVVEDEAFGLVMPLPGVLTDTNLQRVYRLPADRPQATVV